MFASGGERDVRRQPEPEMHVGSSLLITLQGRQLFPHLTDIENRTFRDEVRSCHKAEKRDPKDGLLSC